MKKLRAGVIGLRMGMAHFKAMLALEEFDVVAVCDIDTERTADIQNANPSIKGFSDFDLMLSEMQLDVVAIATPNKLHASMVIKAANAGVKGIYCEKPIALSLGETHEMIAACEKSGSKLIIGHQRRMSAPYITMRRLIDEGAIGEVYLVRGNCAGDILSDGTHTVDSVNYLLGNPKPLYITSQIVRQFVENPNHPNPTPGFRFGHPVESGGMSVIYFEGNIRFEMFTGDLFVISWDRKVPGNAYQDIEVFGTKGRLWRNGDNPTPALAIWDETGGWKAVELDPQPEGDIFKHVFKEFYLHITEGKPHPLSIVNAINDQEIIMGAYESARLQKRLDFPINQMEFPLQVMIEKSESSD